MIFKLQTWKTPSISVFDSLVLRSADFRFPRETWPSAGSGRPVTMPSIHSKDVKKSHEQNRFKVCALCYNESGSKASRPITEHVADIIRRKVDARYELNNPCYGASLCLKCNIDINKLGEDKIEKLRVELSSRFGESIPRGRRGGDGACACIICERATLNGPRWLAFVKMWKNSPGRPSSTTAQKSVRCNICFTEVTSITSLWLVNSYNKSLWLVNSYNEGLWLVNR